MNNAREIHPDFLPLLELKEQTLINLYLDLRAFILEIYTESNELLYHTHALTSVYAVSEKLTDAFCMIPIYSNHLNLGFNKGTLLNDPHQLMIGTGKLIRHIPIEKQEDYRNEKVKELIKSAVALAINDLDQPSKSFGKTISKISSK